MEEHLVRLQYSLDELAIRLNVSGYGIQDSLGRNKKGEFRGDACIYPNYSGRSSQAT